MAKFAAILLAAGRSTRFKGREPKPFADLDGKAVWLRSLDVFSAREDVAQFLVVIPVEERENFELRFTPNLAFLTNASVVEGGVERSDSVRNALSRVDPDIDFIAVHDCARPCLTPKMLADVFDAAERTGAAILACPVADTLKKAGPNNAVANTVDRSGLWMAQTPQVFRRQLLIDAYSRMSLKSKATDDSQLVEALGAEVAIVESDASNLKITTRADLATASAIIKGRPRPGRKAPSILSPTTTSGNKPMQDEADRRIAIRHSYRIQAMLQCDKDGTRTALSCHVHNLSATGAQLMFRGACQPDQRVFVALLDSRRKIVVERRAAVSWIHEEVPGLFRIGVQFDHQLSPDELRSLR